MAIKKENALPIASIVAVIGTAFALWAGVFDRGASSGSLNEKVINLERSISKANDWINKKIDEDRSDSMEYHALKIDIVRLQEQMNAMKTTVEEIEEKTRELQWKKDR